MTTKVPIIVIKKKDAHGGQHGGAWKVAYADFVTAMMALFIVLWLLNCSKQVQDAVGGYFKDPTGTSKKVGSDMVGAGQNFIVSKDNMAELKEELQRAVREVPNFDKLKNHIIMTVTNEGLRIELTESAKGTFYDLGSPKLNEDGQALLMVLAQELGKLPNKIAIEGHTDSKPYAQRQQLQQLGTFRGSREYGAQNDARERPGRKSSHSSPWLRRSAAAFARRPARPFQSPHFAYRAISGQAATPRINPPPLPPSHQMLQALAAKSPDPKTPDTKSATTKTTDSKTP